MRPHLILNVAALAPVELGEHTPHLNRLVEQGSLTPLQAPQPALTSVSHATMLTGLAPNEHGVVGNGWYDPNYAKIFNWNRSDRMMSGEKIWEALKKKKPEAKVANLFWRFCTHARCDFTLTERPTYFANGRKGADVYSPQEDLKNELVAKHGPFPFFNFWGPKASLKSSEWIVNITADLVEREYDLILCYAPGLDYDGQRFGPNSPQAKKTLAEGDLLFGGLISKALDHGYDVSVVSDYGFTAVDQPIYLNRVLREHGYLSIESAANGELLEPGESKAFAVCDNQAAHVYVQDAQEVNKVKELLEDVHGVSKVLRVDESEALGHQRSGQLLAIADPQSWFAYPYWLDDSQAPDFASCVDIFSKPGFDPSEMFMKEGLGGKLHVAKRFIQLKLGIRAPFDVISTRHEQIRGARNINPISSQQGATFISSWSREETKVLKMSELKGLWLKRILNEA